MSQRDMTISVPAASIHCTTSDSTRGDRPVCLVLSAIGSKPYERQMPAELGRRLKLAYVDLRGSGRSTGRPDDLTFDVLAEDLEAVRAALGAQKVAVLGHSILGMLAIEYGRRRPRSVSHVIGVGTPPFGDMSRLIAEGRAFFEEQASDERKQILNTNLAALPAGTPPTQAVFAQTPLRFFDARFDARPLFAEAEIQPEFLPHLMGTLAAGWDVTAGAELRVPILLAHGRHDYVVPHRLWTNVAPALPDAMLRIFERSGHQPFFEEPAAFTEAVSGWMHAAAAR
jgi:proline iminopeptidase